MCVREKERGGRESDRPIDEEKEGGAASSKPVSRT